jgi:hypothetical protein
VERLTSEQIRLLEELRELRDAGILTVEEFESQVAKVLGRPQVGNSSLVTEEPVAHDEALVEEIFDEVTREERDATEAVVPTLEVTHETELLEFEFDGPGTSNEDRMLEGQTQVADPSTSSDSSALPVTEDVPYRNRSSRRNAIVGATAGFVLVAAIALMAVNGEGKGETTPSQVVKGTTTIAQTAVPMTTGAPPTSSTTTVEIPTTTYEVLECPYVRTIEADEGKILTPEGITFEVLPVKHTSVKSGSDFKIVTEFVPFKNYGIIEIENPTNFRLRIGMEVEWVWSDGSATRQWEPDNGRGWLNGFEVVTIHVPSGDLRSDAPFENFHLIMKRATIKYGCP